MLVLIVLVLLTWGVFGQTLRFDFVNYDDQNYVYQNPQITRGLSLAGVRWAFTHVHSQNWHPLTTITHMLDCQLFGLNAGAHHAVNVALHTATVLLLFSFLVRTTGAVWRSAFVAAVFAIHPLRAESVAWISERKDVLSGLFFMLTVFSYVSYARAANLQRYLLLVVVFGLGLLTKPMLVTVPIVLLLLDFWPLQRWKMQIRGTWKLFRRAWSRLVIEKTPLLILSALSCFATLKAQGSYISSEEALPMLFKLGNATMSYVVYVIQTIWPARLAPFYPHPGNTLPLWQPLLSALLLVIVTAAALLWRRQHPYFFTGWLWYLIMLVPVIGVVQVGWQAHADRYTYLPGIGLLVALTWGIAAVLPKPVWRSRLTPVAASSLVVLLACMAWRQTSYWRNSERLWRHTLTVTRNNDVAENNLGILFLSRGNVSQAIQLFENAVEIRATNTEARTNLANAFLTSGRLEDAVRQLRQISAIEPENVEARNTLGAILYQQGQVHAAINEWERVLALQPQNGNAQANLAWVLATYPDPAVRNGARALELAQRALKLAGGSNAMILRTLAAAYAENGRFDDAEHAAERGLTQAEANHNAGLARDFEASIERYRAHIPMRDQSAAAAEPHPNTT
ncbi:MAG: tetratricopeptide repeat protein [Verrucomicrobia bacterium]|nr:tetratricopeptide repeat protein [Verrucomicrobiota bacterium]